MPQLTGLIAATFTPMTASGEVNVEPVPAVVERLLEQDIKGLYVCGSTGEGPSLTVSEREQVARAYVEAARGRVPVVVQVGHNCLEDARRLAGHAASIGADAISAVSPSYFIPESIGALVEVFMHITDAAPELPFYYYHIPRFSGLSLDLLAFVEAAASRIPSLSGIKFSSREVEVMHQCRAFDNGRLNVLFGVDEMLLSGLTAGCDGAVGSTYNFLAPLYYKVMSRLEAGDLPGAQACQRKAAELVAVMLRYHGAAGLKAAMSMTGVDCGPPRLPLTALTQEEIEKLREELEGLGFYDHARRGRI